MNNKKLESKRITRWLITLESSAERVGVKLIPTSHEDYAEDDKYISNFKWCVREVARIKQHGVTAYTKKVGDYCAVYSGLTKKEVVELRDLAITEDEVKAMIKADEKKAA